MDHTRIFRRKIFDLLTNNVADRADSACRALQKYPTYTVPRDFPIELENGDTMHINRAHIAYDSRWDETVGSYVAYQQNVDFRTAIATGAALPGLERFIVENFYKFRVLALYAQLAQIPRFVFGVGTDDLTAETEEAKVNTFVRKTDIKDEYGRKQYIDHAVDEHGRPLYLLAFKQGSSYEVTNIELPFDMAGDIKVPNCEKYYYKYGSSYIEVNLDSYPLASRLGNYYVRIIKDDLSELEYYKATWITSTAKKFSAYKDRLPIIKYGPFQNDSMFDDLLPEVFEYVPCVDGTKARQWIMYFRKEGSEYVRIRPEIGTVLPSNTYEVWRQEWISEYSETVQKVLKDYFTMDHVEVQPGTYFDSSDIYYTKNDDDGFVRTTPDPYNVGHKDLDTQGRFYRTNPPSRKFYQAKYVDYCLPATKYIDPVTYEEKELGHQLDIVTPEDRQTILPLGRTYVTYDSDRNTYPRIPTEVVEKSIDGVRTPIGIRIVDGVFSPVPALTMFDPVATYYTYDPRQDKYIETDPSLIEYDMTKEYYRFNGTSYYRANPTYTAHDPTVVYYTKNSGGGYDEAVPTKTSALKNSGRFYRSEYTPTYYTQIFQIYGKVYSELCEGDPLPGDILTDAKEDMEEQLPAQELMKLVAGRYNLIMDLYVPLLRLLRKDLPPFGKVNLDDETGWYIGDLLKVVYQLLEFRNQGRIKAGQDPMVFKLDPHSYSIYELKRGINAIINSFSDDVEGIKGFISELAKLYDSTDPDLYEKTLVRYTSKNDVTDGLAFVYQQFMHEVDDHLDQELLTTRRWYRPTTDHHVRSDKKYYVRTGGTGTDTDPYTYEQVHLTPGLPFPAGQTYYIFDKYHYADWSVVKYDETPYQAGAAFSYNELGYHFDRATLDTQKDSERTMDTYSLMDEWRRVDYRSAIYVMEQFLKFMDYYSAWKELHDMALDGRINFNEKELHDLEKVQAIYNRTLMLREFATYGMHNVLDIAHHLENVIPVSMEHTLPPSK